MKGSFKMKSIHLNLKRFDILPEYGGVNRVEEDILNWGKHNIESYEAELAKLKEKYDVEFIVYLPEAHLPSALAAQEHPGALTIGSQGVHRQDSAVDGNFGAFTSLRTANSMAQLGVGAAIIGHTEERNNLKDIIGEASYDKVVHENNLLNQSVQRAIESDLSVLFCIGETLEERENDTWKKLLKTQLEVGLKDIDLKNVKIAYEPIWAIGPGKTPPGKEQIEEVLTYLKSLNFDFEVLYGGGLNSGNAGMLASIDQLDGGLIALTNFTGEIGFYADEFINIIEKFLEGVE